MPATSVNCMLARYEPYLRSAPRESISATDTMSPSIWLLTRSSSPAALTGGFVSAFSAFSVFCIISEFSVLSGSERTADGPLFVRPMMFSGRKVRPKWP